jgi:hypothetical protein
MRRWDRSPVAPWMLWPAGRWMEMICHRHLDAMRHTCQQHSPTLKAGVGFSRQRRRAGIQYRHHRAYVAAARPSPRSMRCLNFCRRKARQHMGIGERASMHCWSTPDNTRSRRARDPSLTKAPLRDLPTGPHNLRRPQLHKMQLIWPPKTQTIFPSGPWLRARRVTHGRSSRTAKMRTHASASSAITADAMSPRTQTPGKRDRPPSTMVEVAWPIHASSAV